MGFQVFTTRNLSGNHGFGLRPILFYKEGEVKMADEAGDERGGEEPVDQAGEIDEVPVETQEGKRNEVPKGLPENHSGQNQQKDVTRYGPVKKYLTGVILSGQGIVFGNSKEVFEDRENSPRLGAVENHGVCFFRQ